MKKSLIAFVLAVSMIWAVNIFASLLRLDDSANQETDESMQQPAQEKTIQVLVNGKTEILTMTDYLTGVLVSEMPSFFCVEAKKAQVVAARTFAMRMAQMPYRHGECAVCDDPGCCQGYLSLEAYIHYGGNETDYTSAREAVMATDNYVLVYMGSLIEATYFSCSGGRTEDALAVWGTDVPYLQAVNSPGEEDSVFYTNSVQISTSDFQEKLGVTLSGSPKTWIGKVSYTDGNGVSYMEIGGKLYSGNELRKLLELRSTCFTMLPLEDGLIITTRGFGHRVGMSQYGAEAMAQAGYTWEEILCHYYEGVEIQEGE